jgi:hypothetical protein
MIEATHKRPDLTMPEAEAELLRQHYEEVDMILEYGSGGSTVMASEMEGKYITSVESNKAWWKMMMEWFETNPTSKGSTVNMFYSDIGPTCEWGIPKMSALGNSLRTIRWLCGKWMSYAPQTSFWLTGVSVSDVPWSRYTISNSQPCCRLTIIRHASGCTRPRAFLVNQKLRAVWPRLNLNRSRSQRDVCSKLMITCCAHEWAVRE